MHKNNYTNLQCVLAGWSQIGDLAHRFGRSTELLRHKTVLEHSLQKRDKYTKKAVGKDYYNLS